MAKASKIPHLHLSQRVNKSLKIILLNRFAEMVTCEKDTLNGKDPEALHSMRVSLRRVQAVLKAFRAAFPAKKFKKEYTNIRTLKNALGEVRNQDVFIEKLEKYLKSSIHGDKHALYMMIAKKNLLREKKIAKLRNVINSFNKIN